MENLGCLLRGHHLICLHFFSGEGYDAAFAENLRNVVAVAEEGLVQVHKGADAICKKCPSLQFNKCTHSAQAEDEILAMDRLALRLLGLSYGRLVRWRDLRDLLPSIFRVWYESSCNGCGWKWACEKKKLYLELETEYQRIKGLTKCQKL
ncbi:MAG TPA: DUF1284 domain-containing protein [Dissulfurispiraceae bacterium]|nr:DUF1284 domain-containing protein [Dissulfurispiraceae bacterium]